MLRQTYEQYQTLCKSRSDLAERERKLMRYESVVEFFMGTDDAPNRISRQGSILTIEINSKTVDKK